MKKLNILVFPCGSEVALEIHRSLKFSRHIRLLGASSTADHGKFVFENYIESLPFIHDDNFISSLQEIVKNEQVDAIYPAMDAVITLLKAHEIALGCKVIAAPVETAEICLSKSKTYQKLNNVVATPKRYQSIASIPNFPVFMKPDVGYGSRGAQKINSKEQALTQLELFPDSLLLEYLPGEEFTVDCFTDNKRSLLFFGARKRNRIVNGISVNTFIPAIVDDDIKNFAEKINEQMLFNGAWFFQVKRDSENKLKLLEVAARMGGSSALYRNKGVNFALLSVFNAFDFPVEVTVNTYAIELDRALSNRYNVSVSYNHVYVDLDDCLIINDKINTLLIAFVFQCINNRTRITLLTKHALNLEDTLKRYKLQFLFDEIIHLKSTDEKHLYIKHDNAIFIDDSFAERKKVFTYKNIPVFSPDMVACLLHDI